MGSAGDDAECRKIDGGDDEALLAGEMAVDRFRELRCRREIDRGALKSTRVECRPFIGGQHLVGTLVGQPVRAMGCTSDIRCYEQERRKGRRGAGEVGCLSDEIWHLVGPTERPPKE